MKWHTKFIETREAKRQRALNDYLALKRNKTLTHFFRTWRRATGRIVELQILSDTIRKERDLDLKEDMFLYWKKRLHFVDDCTQNAVNHYEKHLVV